MRPGASDPISAIVGIGASPGFHGNCWSKPRSTSKNTKSAANASGGQFRPAVGRNKPDRSELTAEGRHGRVRAVQDERFRPTEIWDARGGSSDHSQLRPAKRRFAIVARQIRIGRNTLLATDYVEIAVRDTSDDHRQSGMLGIRIDGDGTKPCRKPALGKGARELCRGGVGIAGQQRQP